MEVSLRKEKLFALLRIAFGFVWAADAAFKWLIAINGSIIDVLTQALDGQPAWEAHWIGLWVKLASYNPHLFGILIACTETALAVALIFGILARPAIYLGVPFTLLIWSVPQGFGGPYGPGATDIDSGLIYCLLFVALIIGEAWEHHNLWEWARGKF